MSRENICNINEESSLVHFQKELYETEDTDTEEQAFSEYETDSEECETLELTAPPHSPLLRPQRQDDCDSLADDHNRSRSRSPLAWSHQSTSVPEEYDILLVMDEDTSVPRAQDDYFDPGAHFVYARDDECLRRTRGSVHNVRSVRGRGRPGRGLGDGRSHRVGDQHSQWKLGHPVHEIWASDNDVPLELLQIARDVVRRRQWRHEKDDVVKENVNGGRVPPPRGEALHFEWFPMETFQPEEEKFTPQRTGSVEIYKTPYDAFRSFWDDSILKLIVDKTNSCACKISSKHFQSKWSPTNIHEILMLFAFWMMLGIIRMPSIQSCFSLDPMLKTGIFRRMFKRDRYEQLTKALHFSMDEDLVVHTLNPSTNDPADNATLDRIYQLRPIVNHLNAKFQTNYIPEKDICINENITPWKGKLDIKHHMRSKAAKVGIKTFELCESAIGYLWSFIVYTGKQTSAEIDQVSGGLTNTAVVKRLIGPLLHKGYRLFMDCWFNSPTLARFLKRNGTDCVGTLRPSGKDIPYLVAKAPLERGQFIARHSGDVCVMAWQDKQRVTMLSTCHGSAAALSTIPSKPVSKRSLAFKPQVVLDYNKWMSGEKNLKDQILEPYLLDQQRCAKWYIKLFKRLLNCSILNARILMESSTKHSQNHLVFRLQLVESILQQHISHIPLCRLRPENLSHSKMDVSRLAGDSLHWPVYISTDSRSMNNRQPRSRCFLCVREGIRNHTTPFKCESCNVPLCAVNCFKAYHSSK